MRAFLLFVALLASISAQAKTPESDFPKLSLPRPWELRRLSAPQKLNYYRALQTLVTTIENATTDPKATRNALNRILLPDAEAMERAGDDCLIGGYVSSWYRRADGNLACAAPRDEKIFDTPTAGASKAFFCGGGEKARTAYCNSAVFLYSAENGERFCQPLDGFSSNCQKAFESRYGKQAGGDPHFPERLNRDFERFSRTMSPDELNKYYGTLDSDVNRLIDESKFEKKSGEVLRGQIGILNKTREIATADPAAAAAAPAPPPIAAQAGSSPTSLATTTLPATTVIVNPSSLTTTQATSAAAKSNEAAKPETENAASISIPAAVDPEHASEPPPAPPGEESKLLGKELSCVRDGLKGLGYKPSERFLALVGTGVQATNGAYDSNQENSRQLFQQRVISMVQAYGFCDESSYPSNKMKTHELQLARRWLNADAGKAQAKSGLGYLQQMTDPKALAARDFSDLYGLPFENSAPFTPDEKAWSTESLSDRQDRIQKWKGPKAKSEFEKCHKNAGERRAKDRRFQLHKLRLPGPNKDGKRPPLTDAQKTAISEVQKATTEVCESLARSCSLDAAKTCPSGIVPASPTMSPGIDGTRPAAPKTPAAPIGAPATTTAPAPAPARQ